MEMEIIMIQPYQLETRKTERSRTGGQNQKIRKSMT